MKSAFLNGELPEDVYVDQAKGLVIPGNEKLVYKYRMALYGLRQAPRAWYSKVNQYFLELGFQHSECEPTLYKKKNESTGQLFICLYMDDIIYIGSSTTMVNEFKKEMMPTFEMSDSGFCSTSWAWK